MIYTQEEMDAAKAFRKWAEISEEKLIESYLKHIKGKTNDGLASIGYSGSSGPSGGSVTFFYNHYLKFVDMGVGKGQTLDKVVENKTARALEGRNAVGKRRPKPWYSPVMGREFFILGPIMQQIYGNLAVNTVIEEIPVTFDLDL